MYLGRLKLMNQDGLVLTDVNFHQGINFVVDADDSTRHNKVGKTTFLKLIDIAMGAKDRDGIYVDPSTNSTNVELEQYISGRRTSLFVTLVDRFENPLTTHKLQVGLYKGGRYHIDDEKVTQQDYRRRLKLMLFNSNEANPTFRQLINSFVRISMTGDTDSFLHNLPRSGTAAFRAVYNFLFDISDPSLDQKRGSLSKQLRGLVEGEKQFKHLQNVDDVVQVSQIISTLKNERNRMQKTLNDIVSIDDYKANRSQWMKARTEYQTLTTKLSDVQYQLEQNKEMQDQVVFDSQNDVNADLTTSFFKEVKTLVPDIDKSFDDLVKFNHQLYENKLSYLKTVRKNILEQQEKLVKERDQLTNGNKTLLTLVAEDKLDEYSQLSEKIAARNAEISQQEQLQKQLQAYSDQESLLKEQIAELDNDSNEEQDKYSEKMARFNRYFTDFALRINGERPMLTYVPDVTKFPLSIKDLSGTSTGTRKSIVAAFDLAYQCFAKDEDKAVPQFVVHDLIETVEGDNVKTTVDIANEHNVQYIVAVLKEKLDSSKFTKDEQKHFRVIQLSIKDRLFDEPDSMENVKNVVKPFDKSLYPQETHRKLKSGQKIQRMA